MPVRNRYTTPSTIVRWSRNLLPRFPSEDGINGSISSHWASDNTTERDIGQPSQPGRPTFGQHALGIEVTPALTRKELSDPAIRTQNLVGSLVSQGRLGGSVRIPKAVAPVSIEIDLRAGQVTCSVDVDAPREGRQLTRVNWLVRQLRSAPDSLRVESFAMHSRGAGAAELLHAVRDNPSLLIQDPQRDLRSFRLALTSPLGTKRNRGRGSAIDSVLTAVDTFYGSVLQNLKAWTPSPAKLRDAAEVPTLSPSSLTSTAISSQDGAEPADSGSAADLGGSNDRSPASPVEEPDSYEEAIEASVDNTAVNGEGSYAPDITG